MSFAFCSVRELQQTSLVCRHQTRPGSLDRGAEQSDTCENRPQQPERPSPPLSLEFVLAKACVVAVLIMLAVVPALAAAWGAGVHSRIITRAAITRVSDKPELSTERGLVPELAQ